MNLPHTPPVSPMLAKPLSKVPTDGGWQFDPKWDGFRCIIFRDGDDVVLGSRNERPLTRYFPDIVDLAREHLPDRCVVDGELIVPLSGIPSFSALQLRIHPADSRVERLRREIPASFVAFDLLAFDDHDVASRPLSERRALLERALSQSSSNRMLLSPSTTDPAQAQAWFSEFDGAGLDGVIAKKLDGMYQPGERGWGKLKHRHTIDAVVAGYRLAKDGNGVGSLLLGLYDGELLHFIGGSSGFRKAMQTELLEDMAPLIINGWDPEAVSGEKDYVEVDEGIEPHPWIGSFDGATRRPGGVSRWSKLKAWVPLRPERVVEVTYDQAEDGRLRHVARFVRWRPDKDPKDCPHDVLASALRGDIRQIFAA